MVCVCVCVLRVCVLCVCVLCACVRVHVCVHVCTFGTQDDFREVTSLYRGGSYRQTCLKFR